MKENLKKVVFIIIGFFLTSLFVFNKAFAEAELNEFWEGTGVVGQNLFVYKTYYDSGVLKIEITAEDLQTSGGYTDDVYFRNFEYTSDDQGIKFKTSSNADIFLKYFDCSSSSKVDLNDDWQMRSWCKISDYGTLTLIVYQMKYNGVQIDNYTGLTKTDIDNQWGVDFLESGKGLVSNDVYKYDTSRVAYWDTWSIYNPIYQNVPLGFPFGASPPEPIDGLCGAVDGTTFDYADVESLEFCSAGDFFTITGPVDGYFPYSCQGINGGSTDYCESYYYINGECGTADGGYFSTSPETSTLCSSESYLIFPSFVETSSGWTWICGGYYGGTQSYCSAYLTGTSYPSLPEEEDCSSYTIPDKWICEIKNIFNGAFLPSEAKLNELNIAINSFQTKAPFNYLSSASNILNNVKNGISEDDLSITIMQNTSQVNLNDIEAFTSIIKTFFTILLIFAFLFWGINYIKHFFR